MVGRKIGVIVVAAWAACVLLPGSVDAQSAIAGVVRTTTGEVIPRVTVEASSPALIEGVRSVVTDEQGQYKILDLRPGAYAVTFTLQGFVTIRQEGIELPTNFTAAVNAELKVGSVEGAPVVTGASAVVDVQTAVSQQGMEQKQLDAIPTGGRNIQSVGSTLVGVSQSAPDVGGAAGMQQTYVGAHGSDARDNSILIDGMRVNGIEGDGAIQQYFNAGMFSEMAYQTGGLQPDTSGGGVRLNMILKDGGNTFKGDLFYSTTSKHLQANPLPADLVARGLKAANAMDTMHDFNVSVGGPIKENKLWFLGSYRHWGVNQTVANAFYNASNGLNRWTPDLSRQVVDDNLIQSFVGRLTYQVSPKNKLAGYFDRIVKFRGHEATSGGGIASTQIAEDAFSVRTPWNYYTGQVKWTGTLTSRLLFEVGVAVNNESYTTGELQPGLLETNPIPKVEMLTGVYWGAPSNPYRVKAPVRYTEIATVAYVTGSHALKFGMERTHGYFAHKEYFDNPNVNFIERFSGGVPNSVVIYSTPTDDNNLLNNDLGLYVQDTWTIKRVTLTPGIRFEHFNASLPEQSVPLSDQALFVSEGYAPRPVFPAVKDLPNWNNWAPRVGFAYDVFGNGRTAVKASFARYMIAYSTGFSELYNPMFNATDTRTWTDVNSNLIYDPTIDRLGPSSNKLFGQVFRSPDPDIKRPSNIEFTSSIQQQLRKGMSVSFGSFFRSYKDIIYSSNPVLDAAGASAFTPITIPNPCVVNPTWNCGGTMPDTVTVYSYRPEFIGVGTVVDRNSTRDTRVFTGFDVQFNARFKGATFFAGTSTSRTVSNNCDLPLTLNKTFNGASNPNARGFCDETLYDIPLRTQVKLRGTLDLPVKFTLRGTFQSNAGAVNTGSGNSSATWLPVTYSANPKNVAGLTQGSENIALIYPGSKYLDRWNQLDLRVGRKFRVGGLGDVDFQVDIFNVLNAHPIMDASTNAGSTLNTPRSILQSRIVSVGAQWHF